MLNFWTLAHILVDLWSTFPKTNQFLSGGVPTCVQSLVKIGFELWPVQRKQTNKQTNRQTEPTNLLVEIFIVWDSD